MKRIGQIIKDARVRKKLSVKKVEEITKIKSGFITAIEEERWSDLPTFPTVLGFVKSLSQALGVDEKLSVAVLKRDYPPKALNINPKPDVGSKFSWSPKITFAVGTGLIIVAILGYLGFQYVKFISPPDLSVDSPKENQMVSGNSVLVFGSTDADVKLFVNNQPVLVDADGKFSVSIGVISETKEVTIKAVSRSGKERVVRRTINVRLNY